MTTASTTSSSSTIDWTLGARVKVTTLLDHEIIGTIYSLCQTTNTIALIQESPAASSSPSQPAASSASPNYRIIKTSFIKDVTPLDNAKSKRADASSQSPPPSAASVAAGTPHRDAFARAVPTVGPVQIATIEARARAAVKAERERRAKIGVGVTREAQDLFDLISKTYVTKPLVLSACSHYITVFCLFFCGNWERLVFFFFFFTFLLTFSLFFNLGCLADGTTRV